jgi:FtsP/CotA-like multicopper oxidase with cupredoxin domain
MNRDHKQQATPFREDTMDEGQNGSTRREFVKAAGIGALGTLAAGGLTTVGLPGLPGFTRPSAAAAAAALNHTFQTGPRIYLSATDGYITMPNRESDPIYIFGFIPVPNVAVSQLLDPTLSPPTGGFKGRAQHIGPILDTTAEVDTYIKLTNLGLLQRPDLIDSHTIHWHGFRTPTSLFDGVPEVSIAVPINRQFTYFYRPHNPGTYMYHCHFEDVEHVHMGMTSIVFTRPAGHPNWAYPDASTAFDRHNAILMNEIWSTFHDHDRDIQETIMTDYDPEWFTLNGRCYPQTILPNDDDAVTAGRADLRILTSNVNNGDDEASQPISALVQCNPNERVLLRLANLGYLQHAMELPGIQMNVVGQDATFLGAGGGFPERRYMTNTLYIGPGEARDVLITAPAFDPAGQQVFTDAWGDYNRYFFKNRDFRKLNNNGQPAPAGAPNGALDGLGGMATEVRVYSPTNPVPTPVLDSSGRIPPNTTYVH